MSELASAERIFQTTAKELLSLLADHNIPEKDRPEVARQFINLMRNVMSVADANRLFEILRLK